MYKAYHTNNHRTLLIFTGKGTAYAFETRSISVPRVYQKVRDVFLHERGEGPNLTEWPYNLENTRKKYPDMKEVPFHVKAGPADRDP